ncbi:hypothetical protein [Sinorhizobium medicae]|uniref:hypothetical protein n=1 Tax=Sinorhizobium medicae TaxID=110321 RepID=UPI0011AEE5BB|nr:hypothetical protein [Sinorhizobium medicae]
MSKYDVRIKQVFGANDGEVVLALLGEKVTEWAGENLLRGDPRFADFLAYVQTGGLLHIEFQSTSPANMPWRMLNYRTAIFYREKRWKVPEPPIRQIVIYFCKKSEVEGPKLKGKKLAYDYEEFTIQRLTRGHEFDLAAHSFDLNLLILLGQETTNYRDWSALCKAACKTRDIMERSDRVIMIETLFQLREKSDFVKRELRKLPLELSVRDTTYGKEIYDDAYGDGFDDGGKRQLIKIVSRYIVSQNVPALALEEVKRLNVHQLESLEEALATGLLFLEAVEEVSLGDSFSI